MGPKKTVTRVKWLTKAEHEKILLYQNAADSIDQNLSQTNSNNIYYSYSKMDGNNKN